MQCIVSQQSIETQEIQIHALSLHLARNQIYLAFIEEFMRKLIELVGCRPI